MKTTIKCDHPLHSLCVKDMEKMYAPGVTHKAIVCNKCDCHWETDVFTTILFNSFKQALETKDSKIEDLESDIRRLEGGDKSYH